MPKTNKKAKGERNIYKDNSESVLGAGEPLLGLLTAKPGRSCSPLHNVIGLRNIGSCFVSSTAQIKPHKIHGNTPRFSQ